MKTKLLITLLIIVYISMVATTHTSIADARKYHELVKQCKASEIVLIDKKRYWCLPVQEGEEQNGNN
jgi:hypothetical protein